MTQTVSLQRGSASFSSGSTTLFTLGSGGTANRVIFNNILVRFTSGANWIAGTGFHVLWTPSGGSPSPIGGLFNNSGNPQSVGGFSLLPVPSGIQVTAYNTSSNRAYGQALVKYQNVGTSYNFSNSNIYAYASGGDFIPFLTQQVWGGPSDSVSINNGAQYISGKSSYALTGVVYWDCVVINES